jgi:hypothetical protein
MKHIRPREDRYDLTRVSGRKLKEIKGSTETKLKWEVNDIWRPVRHTGRGVIGEWEVSKIDRSTGRQKPRVLQTSQMLKVALEQSNLLFFIFILFYLSRRIRESSSNEHFFVAHLSFSASFVA